MNREKSVLITVKECRVLRKTIYFLTKSPVVTQEEFFELAEVLLKIIKRLEKENVNQKPR